MPTSVSAEDLVRACYRSFLMREPDSDGFRDHVRQLATDAVSIDDMLSSFMHSTEYRASSSAAGQPLSVSEPGRITSDHSQFGEFSLLIKKWVNTQSAHRIVVDVGARGRERSNSFDLLRSFGWKAVLIEANPALITAIQRDFHGLSYELLNFAISNYDGHATFHIGINNDVSSLAADAALSWGEIIGNVQVDVRRLGPLLVERAIPLDFDLLTLDIEGEDLKVLSDLMSTTSYRPRWVIIEASNNYQTKSLRDLNISADFELDYEIFDQTPANLLLQYVGRGRSSGVTSTDSSISGG